MVGLRRDQSGLTRSRQATQPAWLCRVPAATWSRWLPWGVHCSMAMIRQLDFGTQADDDW